MSSSAAWTALFAAGLFEAGWALGLKLGWSDGGPRWAWIALAAVCLVLSGALLLLAQRVIPLGTAYAVWTGIGIVGTVSLGISQFGESAAPVRLLCVGLILLGIAGLQLTTDGLPERPGAHEPNTEGRAP